MLGALQQWGDEHLPWPQGPTVVRQASRTGRPLHVGFVDDRGREVAAQPTSSFVRTAYPPIALDVEATRAGARAQPIHQVIPLAQSETATHDTSSAPPKCDPDVSSGDRHRADRPAETARNHDERHPEAEAVAGL